MAERAGGDEAVGAGVDRVANVGPGLLQRGLAVHRDHREAAAFAGAVVLDDLAAERRDHLLQVDVTVGVLAVAEPLLRPHDVAAVEGADPESGQRSHHLRSKFVEPVVLDQQPEEVFVVPGPVLGLLVGQALAGERLVDVRPVGRVGVESLLALRLRALAGRADVHHREPGLLGEGEGAGVERVGQLLVVLGDHAGAAAVGAVEGDQLDPERLGDPGHRAVQLRGEASGDAAGPVGDFDLISHRTAPRWWQVRRRLPRWRPPPWTPRPRSRPARPRRP